MRVYCLIIYFYKKGTDTGFCSVDGYFRHNPPTMTDIQDMQKEIQEKFSVDGAMVLNWLPLSDDEEDTTED